MKGEFNSQFQRDTKLQFFAMSYSSCYKHRYCTYVRIWTICVIPLGYFTKITPTKFAEYQKLDYKTLISCTAKLPNRWKSNKNSYQYPLESNHMYARTHTHTHIHKSETTRAFFCRLIFPRLLEKCSQLCKGQQILSCLCIYTTVLPFLKQAYQLPRHHHPQKPCSYPTDFQCHHLLFIALNGGSSSDVTDPTQWNHWLNKHFHTGENLARKTFCCVK